MKTHITSIGFANCPPDMYATVHRSDGSEREYHFPQYNKYGTPYSPKWYARLESAWRRRSRKQKEK